MSSTSLPNPALPFSDPGRTASGERRAQVPFAALQTLWLNTGTLCNIACEHCYIEASPENDRLAYLTLRDVEIYLDEIRRENLGTKEIGITGGEPFMNPDILPILQACLGQGFAVLVLTNAMRPMMRPRVQAGLLDLRAQFGSQLTLRVSIDHYDQAIHETERGPNSWQPMLRGLRWLQQNRFNYHIAGRTRWGANEQELRAGYARTLSDCGLTLDPMDSTALVLFPELDPEAEVPEITTACWDLLGVNPADMMCATSRMVVKHQGDLEPTVTACTLLPYEPEFRLGPSLTEASGPVALNHPSCAKFCVLGGGSCSG